MADALDLEVLKKQYETILLQYNQAQADYIQYLQRETKDNDNSKEHQYTEIKGKAFWGSKSLSEQSSQSIDQCKSLCSSVTGCSGATYNPDKKYCWLRSGEGTITEGETNDYAIIPEKIRLMKSVQNFANSLTSINEKILKRIAAEQPTYNNQTKESEEQVKILTRNYHKLVQERNKIEAELSKQDDISQGKHDAELNIQKYRSFYLLSIIGVFFIIFLFGKQLMNVSNVQFEANQSSTSGTILLLGILVFLFILAIPYLKIIREFVGI